MSIEFEGMRKSELIAFLNSIPGDPIVGFAEPTHDHWGSELFRSFNGEYEEKIVTQSTYHDGFKIVDTDDDTDEEEESHSVIVVS